MVIVACMPTKGELQGAAVAGVGLGMEWADNITTMTLVAVTVKERRGMVGDGSFQCGQWHTFPRPEHIFSSKLILGWSLGKDDIHPLFLVIQS
jgi:hypothetical protein